MRLLLVFINSEYRPMVPVNINMIEMYVKSGGHEVKVFDSSFYKDVINIERDEAHVKVGTFSDIDYSGIGVEIKDKTAVADLVGMIRDFEPDLIGIGVYSFSESIVDNMSKVVKENFPDIPILWGGTHPTIVPEATISKKWVDMICVGEGEKAVLKLCDNIEAGKSIDDINNIWLKKNGKILRNSVGSLIDPTELPAPNFDSYATYQQYGPVEGKIYRLGMVEFSRGCPNSCAYCENPTIKNLYTSSGFTKFVRSKTPRKFVAECKSLVNKYGTEYFYFVDGTFLVMPDKVLEELAVLFSEEVNRPFMCLSTVPSVTEKRAKLLKKMGCRQINMGIEAGNEKYRRDVLNRPNMTNKRISDAFKFVRDAGIHVSAYNIIGIPWQDRDGVFETIELNRIIQPDRTHLSIYIPYEGTQLRERLVKEGYVDDYTKLGDATVCTVKVPRGMDEEEILGLQRTFNLYCKVPKELFPLLEACEKDNEISRFVLEKLRKIYLFQKRNN